MTNLLTSYSDVLAHLIITTKKRQINNFK